MNHADWVQLANNMNMELLYNGSETESDPFGCRLRPYGKGWPADTMVLAKGKTIEDAVEAAYDKAVAGRFEPLDWRARPWEGPNGALAARLSAPQRGQKPPNGHP